MTFSDQKPLLHLDANGNPYFGGSYAFFNAVTAGQLIDSSPTYAHRINITKSGDAASLVTIYDGINASAPVVAQFDASKTGSFELGSHQINGLYVVISGTTAPIVTILYSSRNTGG